MISQYHDNSNLYCWNFQKGLHLHDMHSVNSKLNSNRK
jgi:hypothetical protein